MNLNTIANNLANVNTTGFKKNKIEFQDMLYQKKREVGAEQGAGNLTPTSVEVGNGTRVVSTAKVYTQGQLTQTGEKMDVAIQGDGFFEVQRPDGTTAYTRDGGFKLIGERLRILGAELGDHVRVAIDRMAGMHDAMLGRHDQTMNQMGGMMQMLAAPKRIVRGPDGRASGVELMTQ